MAHAADQMQKYIIIFIFFRNINLFLKKENNNMKLLIKQKMITTNNKVLFWSRSIWLFPGQEEGYDNSVFQNISGMFTVIQGASSGLALRSLTRFFSACANEGTELCSCKGHNHNFVLLFLIVITFLLNSFIYVLTKSKIMLKGWIIYHPHTKSIQVAIVDCKGKNFIASRSLG